MSESRSEYESQRESAAPSSDPESITLEPSTSEPALTATNGEKWAYQPPPEAVLADHEIDPGEFEWANIEDDEDLELWLIRVPEGIKPKYLDNLRIDQPPSAQAARLGTLDRKSARFDIWSVAGDDDRVGGEEIKGLSCLLPRKRKKGKLYQIPKPIAHHLVISAQAVRPAPDPGALIFKNPPREKYPKELLKHRFLPYGSQAPVDVVTPDADVEMAIADAEVVDDVGKAKVVPQPEVVTKKRKNASDTPKKIKKAKRAA